MPLQTDDKRKAFELLDNYVAEGLIKLAQEIDKQQGLGYFEARKKNEQMYKHLERIQTSNESMLKLKQQVKLLAPLESNVLIIGESGTGKDVIAHALHGSRDADKFIPINCAGLPETLLESELFGHVRGAFTGAASDKQGLFSVANEGTVFLDEIGDMPLPLQAKLLRVLEDKKVRKVGGLVYESVTCRIIAATHQNLVEDVKAKKFRLDLYARLSTFVLRTVPLRDRLQDITLIVDSMLTDEQRKVFPYDKVQDWQTLDPLNCNIRRLLSIIEHWQVFGTIINMA